jgi:hypothetical protein
MTLNNHLTLTQQMKMDLWVPRKGEQFENIAGLIRVSLVMGSG